MQNKTSARLFSRLTARNERIARRHLPWPRVLPVRLDDADLLGCACDQAERAQAGR